MTAEERRTRAADGGSSPLAETLARVSALDKHVAARLLPRLEAGWQLAGDLVTAGEPGWLDDQLSAICARYGLAERRVAANFFMGWYAWYVTAAAIAAYLTERRVPNLAVGQLAVR